MKINKKIIFLFILAVGIFAAISTSAQITAIEGQLKAAAEEGAGYSSPQDPRTTAAVIIRAAFGVVGTVFLILMIYAGATWMTAGGNEEQVAKGKKNNHRFGDRIYYCYFILRDYHFCGLYGNRREP